MKMTKKRNRQPDVSGELNEDSTDSCGESNTSGNKCPHIPKAVNINKIKKYVNKVGISKECSICKQCKNNSSKIDEEECVTNSAILVCLQCGHQGCKREEGGHAVEHFKKPHSDCHVMVVETLHWNVWCFECEAKINIGCRKKLQETIGFIKKSTTAVSLSQPKMTLSQGQNNVDVDKKEKEKSLHNLPKVGGLMNLGNTCFFNAVLQCLAQTPFLVKVLDDLRLPGQKFVLPGGKHKLANSSEEVDLPSIEGTLEGWGGFTSILCKTLIEMQNSDGRLSYRPLKLLHSFKKKTMQCMDGGQHDSHELLRHLLEIVRNEDLRRYQSIILKEVGLNGKTNPEDVEESLKSRVKFYGNQASTRLLGPEPVFRGVLVSTLECLDCHHSSQSTEPFLDLSLPVTADKPQPPVLKRKNNSFEDTFDIMGNNISHASSKHQLKKEKKAARKNRKSKKQEILSNNDSFATNKSRIVEENNSVLESEVSDADVEDNTEIEGLLPEVGESGYSSEKQSTLVSPASPSTNSIKTNDTTTEIPLDNYIQFNATDTISLVQLLNRFAANMISSSNPTNMCSINVSQAKSLKRLESSESLENENEIQTGFSASTSLPITSDLTNTEVPVINLSSVTLKQSPVSSLSALTNGKVTENIKLSTSSLNFVESASADWTLVGQEEITCNQWKTRRKIEEYYSNNITNGINNITSGISKIGISGSLQQSPTRYPTKEGECSVQSCLNQFTALELMSGSNKVSCEACTAREKKMKENCKMICTPSTKQYLISQVPAVLILHLKRFQALRVDFRKVTKHVSFPMLLDLAPICKNYKKTRIYALYGVVEHSGTIHGGHYVAYVKSRLPLTSDDPRWSFLPPKDVKDIQENSYSSSSDSESEEAAATPSSTVESPPGKWYYVSDSRVTEVDEATVLQSQAYLLFYERIL